MLFNVLLRLTWKRKWHILAYLSIFLFFSFINTNKQQEQFSFKQVALDIEIVNAEKTTSYQPLIDYLKESNHVRLSNLSEKELREKVFLEEIDGAIILPIEEHAKEETSSKIKVITNQQNSRGLLAEAMVQQYLVFEDAIKHSDSRTKEDLKVILSKKAQMSLNTKKQNDNEMLVWAKYYFNFVLYVILMMFIHVFGLILSELASSSLSQRIELSPQPTLKTGIQKVGGLFLAALFITLTFILSSLIFYPNLAFETNFVKHVVFSLAFMITTLCLTYMLSEIIGQNHFFYNGMSTVISLGSGFLSGIFIPLELLPKNILHVIKLLPTYYVVEANNQIHSSFSMYKYNLAILLLFGFVYFMIGLSVYRLKQRPV